MTTIRSIEVGWRNGGSRRTKSTGSTGPPNSPDANPIENVWRPLKDNVAARRPKNLDQLERYIREEWAKFTPDYAATLVGSMPNRISELIKQNGDVIQY